jgi:hypothetical protein
MGEYMLDLDLEREIEVAERDYSLALRNLEITLNRVEEELRQGLAKLEAAKGVSPVLQAWQAIGIIHKISGTEEMLNLIEYMTMARIMDSNKVILKYVQENSTKL